MSSRRNFLKASLIGGLAVASGVSLWQLSLTDSQQAVEQDDYNYQYLTEDDRLLLFALLPAFLGEALKEVDSAKFRLRLLQDVDQALGFISQSSYDELRQLLDLLSNQLGRAYLAGIWTNWNRASSTELSNFLANWRESFLALQRAGYLGLHQLIFGTFYVQEESWSMIGYSGAPQLNLDESFYLEFE